MSFDLNKISLSRINDEKRNKLLKSVELQLNLNNNQLYYPGYKDFLEEYKVDDDYSINQDLNNLVIDSKYLCTEILCRIQYDSDSEDDSDNGSDNGSDNESDNSENSNNSDNSENSDNSDNNNIQLNNLKKKKNTHNLEQKEENEEDIQMGLENTFSIIGKVQKKKIKDDQEIINEYPQKIFVKKSPLLEPIKIILDQYDMNIDNNNNNNNVNSNMLPNNNISNTVNKINSSNNASHVEALFLYLGNKLVEMGKCPTFPYYYGCVNSIDNNYYYNIDEEYDNIKDEDWFLNKINNELELIEIELDDDSSTSSSFNSSLNDEDIDNLQKLLLNNNDLNNEINDTVSSNDDESDYDEPKITEISDNEEVNEQNSSENKDGKLSEEELIDSFTSNSNKLDFIEELNLDDDELVDIMDNDFDLNKLDSSLLKELSNNSDIVEINNKLINNLEMQTMKKIEASDTQNNSYHDKIEELNIDEEFDNMSLSDFKKCRKSRFVKFENVPINLCLMEHMNHTLDDLLDEGYPITTIEWYSILFQVIFGLAVAQKHFYFVHNDLHSSNIMFQNTKEKFLYFFINRNYYKIPTFNKVTKIIDFARGTFKLGDKWIFSDVFHPEGEAAGQYDYPEGTSLKNCKIKPNPSFDMIRLISTIKERLIDFPEVMLMVSDWTVNDDGHNVLNDEDDFDLYIEIAHNCHKAVPLSIIKHENFKQFRVRPEHIPKNKFIYFF